MPPTGVCCFSVEDGIVTCLQADPVVEIADRILEEADPNFVHVEDGVVTFHCDNGDVSYGLHEYDDITCAWTAIRI